MGQINILSTDGTHKAGLSFTGTSDVTVDSNNLSGLTGNVQTQLDAKVTKVSSTDNAIVRFDGTTGQVQNSSVTIDDSGIIDMSVNGFKAPLLEVVSTVGYTVADGWSNVSYNLIRHQTNCSHNGVYNFDFNVPGRYLITHSFRFGTGGDVWTGVRLYNSNNANVMGLSHGTGQVVNDPASCTFSFIANVTANDLQSTGVYLQWYRGGSTMGIATPLAGFDAVKTTVTYIGAV